MNAHAAAKVKPIKAEILAKILLDNTIPSFSGPTHRLLDVTNQDDTTLDEIVEIIKLDPGLSARFVKVASSVAYGGKSVRTLQDAVFRMGFGEVRRMATFAEAAKVFQKLQVEIDWHAFWVHSLLVARVTEAIYNVHQPSGGEGYLAGLLHDVGKLYFRWAAPTDFEAMLLHAERERCDMNTAEQALFDITHADISGELCEKWKVHRGVARSVRFHHAPTSYHNKDPIFPENQQLLATCLSLADALATLCGYNMMIPPQSATVMEELPQWKLLRPYPTRGTLELNLETEIRLTTEAVNALELPSCTLKVSEA